MRPIRSLLPVVLAAHVATHVAMPLVAMPLVAMPLAAQTALIADATVRSAPGGSVIAVLKKGTTVAVGAARGGDVRITFSGWLDGTRLAGAKDSFPAHLTGTIAMRLRSAPSMKGVILGEVRVGTGLTSVSRHGSWADVRRSGWVDARTLQPGAAKANASAGTPSVPSGRTGPAPGKPAPNKPAPAKPAPAKSEAAKPEPKPAPANAPLEAAPVEREVAVEPMPDGVMRVVRSAITRTAPNGIAVGRLDAGAIVAPLARARGWVRVRTDVWVQEGDIVPVDASFGAALSAADLRADPDGTRGKTVRWDVQVLALQRADPLRRDLAVDEPYFLAKGPGSEDALIYLAIPPSLLGEARSVQPLSRLLVTARVRAGRSQPVGIPILDILSFAKQ